MKYLKNILCLNKQFFEEKITIAFSEKIFGKNVWFQK